MSSSPGHTSHDRKTASALYLFGVKEAGFPAELTALML